MIPKTPNVLFTFETWMYGRPFLEFEKTFTVTFEKTCYIQKVNYVFDDV